MNGAKYLSYKEAWRRIKIATEQGFYFEAVTLCESIIADRLLSYVRGVDPASKASLQTPLANLISQWRKLASGRLPSHGDSDLGSAVDAWREERNAVVHSLAKSAPGTATVPVQPFLTRAEQAAKTGAVLARAVSSWQTQQLRSAGRKNSPARDKAPTR